MPSREDVPNRMVYRPLGGRILLGVFVAIAVWWVVDLLARGRVGQGAVGGLWLVAVTSALACLFWRPAVVVDDEGVELRNVVRDVRVPWAALDEIETRFTLTLHARGRRHQSWAGVAPARPTPTKRLLGGAGPTADPAGPHGHRLPDPRWTTGGGSAAPAASRDLAADSGATAFLVEQRWQAWRERSRAFGAGRADDAVVEVRWRWLLPAIAAASAVVALALMPLAG